MNNCKLSIKENRTKWWGAPEEQLAGIAYFMYVSLE